MRERGGWLVGKRLLEGRHSRHDGEGARHDRQARGAGIQKAKAARQERGTLLLYVARRQEGNDDRGQTEGAQARRGAQAMGRR